jgi:signal transduction histidine kinase
MHKVDATHTKQSRRSTRAPAVVTYVVALGIVCVGAWLAARKALVDIVPEVDQRIHLDYASRMGSLVRPHLDPTLDCAALRQTLEKLEAESGRFHLYLLDDFHVIRCSTRTVVATMHYDSVRPDPIVRILERGGDAVPIDITDPRSPTERKPFSASRIDVNGRTWYLLAILGGQNLLKYDDVSRVHTSIAAIRRYHRRFGSWYLFLFATLPVAWLIMKTRRFSERRARSDSEQDPGSGRNATSELTELSRDATVMTRMLLSRVKELSLVHEERQTFVAGISHDLRSPLASVRGYLETLETKGASLSDDARAQHVTIVRKNVERVLRLIEQMVEAEKCEFVQETMERRALTLDEIVEEAYHMSLPIAKARGVELSLANDRTGSIIKGDASLVARAVSNVVDNALKFAGAGGRVSISATKSNSETAVSISDTGPGISETDLPYIFHRFYRGRSRAESDCSTGLGLFIVKRIVEAHGGQVSVRSALGEGTTFTLRFPCERWTSRLRLAP